MSKLKDYTLLLLKGISMGAADVVPGVSGGTIAFITGIYEELINSLKSIDASALKMLMKGKPASFWLKINGTFLLVLFSGVLISIFSLASLLKSLISTDPVLVWSFFFGLIVASAFIVTAKIKKWDLQKIIALVFGVVAMYLVTRFSPAETTETYWFIFISGALAICAMILPGISGAFILLILGKYHFILTAISNLDILVILVFGAGVVTGLLSFARFLSWLLGKYHDITISVLAGFIIGSLNKIWPWKETVTTRINSRGDVVPVLQNNVSPWNYSEITGMDPQLLYALLLFFVGIIMVILLERIGRSAR